jgi:hypothetical protein
MCEMFAIRPHSLHPIPSLVHVQFTLFCSHQINNKPINPVGKTISRSAEKTIVVNLLINNHIIVPVLINFQKFRE